MADEFDTSPEEENASQWLQDMSGEDEFDSLRRKSARASTVYEDMEVADDDPGTAGSGASSGGLLGRFSPVQGLVLAVLLLFNLIAIFVLILVFTGRFDPF